MFIFFLILFGIVTLLIGFGSAVKKPLSNSSEYNASELETWKILEKRFGMKRAREIMEVERWKYKRWNQDMKCMKYVLDTETGEWVLKSKSNI